MKDPLDDALGLPPMPRRETEIIIPERITDDPDYEYARESLYRLAAKAEMHLDELGEIATISQHPRAFEVYSNLLKTAVDTNKELMALKKTQRELAGPTNTGPHTINHNQTLVMTTDEVLKMIKGEK